MKIVTRTLIWVAVFLVVLVLRFPYSTVFENAVERIEQSTGAKLSWETCSIGLTGAHLTGFAVQLASGMSFAADRVTARPSWGGFATVIEQTTASGSCQVSITPQELHLQASNLEVDTGSKDLKKARMTGDFTYLLASSTGKGELRLELDELTGVLPVTLRGLKIGTVTTIEAGSKNSSREKADNEAEGTAPAGQSSSSAPNASSRSVIHNKLSLLAQGMTGEGTADLTLNGDGSSPQLAGQLTVKTDNFGAHTINISGTWARPEWNLAGAKQ